MRLLRGSNSVRQPIRWLGRAAFAALLLLTSCSSAADGETEVAQPEISQPDEPGVDATDTAQPAEVDAAIPPTSVPITADDGSLADGGINDPNRGLRDPGAEDAVNAAPPAGAAPTEDQNDQAAGAQPEPAQPAQSDQPAQPDQPAQLDQPDAADVDEPAAVEPAPEAATPPPTATPVPVVVAPDLPLIPAPSDGPLPSDELEIQGPAVIDDALTIVISESGALACSAAEAAITFLDAGDATRMTEELTRASELAAAATEGEIRAAAPVLAAVAGDLDAGFDAIVFTLSACAVHGYQV